MLFRQFETFAKFVANVLSIRHLATFFSKSFEKSLALEVFLYVFFHFNTFYLSFFSLFAAQTFL